jgi:subtilisin-like proprotein convertase family protein
MTKSIVEARKRKQLEQNDDADFSVGTIPGLDDVVVEMPTSETKQVKTETKESVADMTTTKTKSTTNVSAEQLEGTVALKLRSEYSALVSIIENKNAGVIVQDFGEYLQLNAKQIRITRQDAENTLGKMNDGRWRMLLMNRKGEVANFNNYELVLGIIETEADEVRETAQLNTRIESKAKEEMDEIRTMLGMTQSQFLEVAIKEFAEKVRSEMI